MKKVRKKLTYANVMSSLAVFLVLGGATAFAASHLGKNSVGTAQLKANAVTGSKIARNAVTGRDLQDGSVNAAEIQDGSVNAAEIQDGSVNAAEIQDGSVTGSDISNGSVTGSDIDTKTLGTVPSANALVGQDHFSFTAKGTQEIQGLPEPFVLKAVCTEDNPGRKAEFQLSSSGPPIHLSSEGEPVIAPLTLLSVEEPAIEPGSDPAALKTSSEQFLAVATVGPAETLVSILIKDLGVGVNAGGVLNEECVFAGTVERLQ